MGSMIVTWTENVINTQILLLKKQGGSGHSHLYSLSFNKYWAPMWPDILSRDEDKIDISISALNDPGFLGYKDICIIQPDTFQEANTGAI